MGVMFFKRIEDLLADNGFEIVESNYEVEGYPDKYVRFKLRHQRGPHTTEFFITHDDTRKGFYKAFTALLVEENLPWKLFIERVTNINPAIGFSIELVWDLKDLILYFRRLQADMSSVAIQLEILYGEKGA